MIISLYLFLLFVDINNFKTPIEKEVSEILNREVVIDRMNLKMSLTPTFRIRGVRIKNEKGFDEELFAKVDEAELSFAVVPLFKGIFQVDELLLNGVNVSLEEKDGKNNWSFKKAVTFETTEKKATVSKKEKTPPLVLSRLNLREVSVKNAEVSYLGPDKKERLLIQNLAVTNMKDVFVELLYQENVISVSLTVPEFLNAVSSGEVNNFNLNIKGLGGEFNVTGIIQNIYTLKGIKVISNGAVSNLNKTLYLILKEKISSMVPEKPLQLSFRLTGDFPNLKIENLKSNLKDTASLVFNLEAKNLLNDPNVSLNGNFSFDSKEVTKKYGIQPITAEFDLLYGKKAFSLNKLDILVNKSDLHLSANVDFTKTIPFVKADISSDYFSISDLQVKDQSKNVFSEKKDQKTISKENEKLDLSFLKRINGEAKISFSNLKLVEGINAYHKGFFNVSLNDGLLIVNPFRVDLLSGEIVGVLQVNAKNQIPLISTHIKGTGLKPSEIESVKPHVKDMPVDVDAVLTASGVTVTDILSSLTGNVQAEITSGIIVNKWFNSLPGVIKNMPKNSAFSYSGTDMESNITCAAAKLTIENGVIKSDKNLAIETPMLNITVSGDVDLSKEYLSLSLLPSLNQSSSGSLNKKLSFAQYVKVEGPFSDVKMKNDIKGALETLKNQQLNKLAQKMTGEKKEDVVQNVPAGSLCQEALGKKAQPVQSEVLKNQNKTEEISSKKDNSLKELKEVLKDKVKDKISTSLINIMKKD